MTSKKTVEFRGRLVVPDYPTRHAEAQAGTTYNDYPDGVARLRIPYGAPKDRYPGGITYATREERVAFRIKNQQQALNNFAAGLRTREEVEAWYPGLIERGVVHDPGVLVPATEVIRTDHRCPDCDVEVGELHLPGCHVEVCPKCLEQAISCACALSDNDEDDEDDEDDESAEDDEGEEDDEDDPYKEDEGDEPRSSLWQRLRHRVRQIGWRVGQIWWRVRYRKPREVVIYARSHGSDSEGVGTLDRPYKTLQRAMRDIPTVIPPHTNYRVDITGTITHIGEEPS